jgi:hypothetical protein
MSSTRCQVVLSTREAAGVLLPAPRWKIVKKTQHLHIENHEKEDKQPHDKIN